jgi:hypothetical protein
MVAVHFSLPLHQQLGGAGQIFMFVAGCQCFSHAIGIFDDL